MKETTDRVTILSWEKLKKYIPAPKDSSYPEFTPLFGYVIDRFRTLYGIYISVTPNMNSDISNASVESGKLIFGYTSDVFRLSGNNVLFHWSGNNQSFVNAIRNAIDIALDYIKDQRE